MGVGEKIRGAPSSIASLSIMSNPSQKLVGGVVASLGASLFFFSVDVVRFPPLLLVPMGGEIESLMMKSGSTVRLRAVPLLPPAILILHCVGEDRVIVLSIHTSFFSMHKDC